jgi:hypothetical protein
VRHECIGAATRDGALRIEGFPDLKFIAFWLLPIVVSGLVLAVIAARRDRDRDPDLAPPALPHP